MNRLLSLLVVAGLILACGSNVANAVVVIGGALNNGDLDDTYPQLIIDNPDPGPPFDFYLPKPTVWINEGSRLLTGPYEDEMSSTPWSGPAPTPVTTNGNGLPEPDGCAGNPAELDCGGFFKPFTGGSPTAGDAATGHLYQDNPATPGMKYTLTGWAGAEPNALMGGAEIALEFLDIGGSVIPLSGQVIDLLPTLFVDNGLAFDYKMYTAMGVAPANAVSVRARASMIDAYANPLGGGQAFVVDDFTLTCVPEPTSFAMAGLALIGLFGFRRRSR
jgi:hypothetical protein